MITVTALSGPAMLGSNWVPPHPGRMPRKHSGNPTMVDVAGHGAVLAVQGEFEAAAERDPVDEGERRDLTVAQPAEHPVTESADGVGGFGVGKQRDAGEVGAGGEDERLAGDGYRDRPRGEGRIERSIEVAQAGGTEGGGSGVVLAVVDGDECDGPIDVRDGDQP